MFKDQLVILMAEDDPADTLLMKRALEQGGARHVLHSVKDGEEAIAYLCGKGKFADRATYPTPNIILTDLKMARMDGFEFLEWLQTHPECAVIPTIVFSASSDPGDVKKAYDLGVNSYMVKPTNLNDLGELIRITYEYWSRCERPDRAPSR